MSECVIRMEMPESCGACPCLDDYGDYPRCRISGEQRGYNFPIHEKRMPNCPISCSLPEGHGRLIDADSMEKEVCGGCVHGEHKYANCIDCALANAPTIVPAERSET